MAIKVVSVRIPDLIFMSVLHVAHAARCWLVFLRRLWREPWIVELGILLHLDGVKDGDTGGGQEEDAVIHVSMCEMCRTEINAHKMTTPKLLAVYESLHFFSEPKANVAQLASSLGFS